MRLIKAYAAGIAATLALLPHSASAYCSCACVNGKSQNVCTSQFDIEVYCVKYCPQSALPPGVPQRNPDLEGFASDTGKANPQDKLFIGGQ